MKRSVSFFLSKFKKTLRYLYYSFDCAFYLRDLKILYSLFSIHVLGANRDSLDSYTFLFPDRAGVFSNYWANWHRTHYRFLPSSLFVMGTPDFRKQHFSSPRPDNHIAYCYQTLVEDGRIHQEQMLTFYRDMIDWTTEKKMHLVIKAHPRMSSFFRTWFTEKGIEIESSTVPNVKIVIGHYSSFLSFWGSQGRQVYCVQLPGHDIDPSYTSWAKVVSHIKHIDLRPFDYSEACVDIFGLPISLDELSQKLALE